MHQVSDKKLVINICSANKWKYEVYH